jgi:glycosyltransferase involved in cell wall biosynthesis
MDRRSPAFAATRTVLLIASVACLLCSGLLPDLGLWARAWLQVAGFGLLVPATAMTARRHLAPIAVAVIFFVFGGLSALVAIPESAKEAAQNAKSLSSDQLKASRRSPQFENVGISESEAFKEAALLTALGGLAGVGGAYLGSGYLADRRRRRLPPAAAASEAQAESDAIAPPSARRIEYAGRGLVAAAFVGVALALIRFAVTQLPTNDLHMAIKSFWNGGSYFLLLATFAIPGFGLWLQGALARGAPRRDLWRMGSWVLLYLILLVPTGQRGFAIALGLMWLVIFFFDGRLRLRYFSAIVAIGIIGIGVSQAVRNEIREDNGVSPSGLLTRLEPREWRSLYGSQLASFVWTVQVVEFKGELHAPNPFLQALLKPVPRQIYPGKSQGFGSEFTAQVYPAASKQGTSFAIPLVGESYYAFGLIGVVLIFALFGLGGGLAESLIANRGPTLIKPIVLATIGWCAFVLVRGDFANALVFAAGWVLPLLIVARSVGLRRPPPIRRIVVDALQVAPEFSGIGRRLAEIGESFREADVPVPLVVRCAADVEERLRAVFPPDTTFQTPLRRSRPRILRIAYQQLLAPLLERPTTLLVCPGDQAPGWGRAPLVFVVHDVRRLTQPGTSRAPAEAFFYRTVMRWGVARARRIVTVSEFSRGELERTLAPTCPVTVVAAHPRPCEQPPLPAADSLTFLTVGALRSYKGLETVIDALARLGSNGGVAARVVCVGGGEGDDAYRDQLSSYAKRMNVEGRFELAGWISDEELRALYGRCAGTINPSSYEGYGLPVAESLAQGLPTIASDIPPHREIAGEAALYFGPGDAEGLASLLVRLAEEPTLRESMSRLAIERSRRLAQGGTSWAEAILAALPATATAPDLERPVEPAAAR